MDRYQLDSLIYSNYQNGCSVYRAYSLPSFTPVCLKQLSITASTTPASLQQEAMHQASFKHPNICKVLDQFYCEGGKERYYCIVMELLATDLNHEAEKRRQRYQFWTEAELWQFLTDITDALSYLQSLGVSHRDIKPHNLFLTHSNCVKLGDFGACRDIDPNSSMTLQGTPLYLSPKLRSLYNKLIKNPMNTVTTRHNTYKSDVFSLGVTMLHLAALEAPMDIETKKWLGSKNKQCIERLNLYSNKFKSVLRLMLERKEHKRPDCHQLRKIISEQCGPVQDLSSIHCLSCMRIVALTDNATVHLPCAPEHCFCSPDCFCTFVTETAESCSACHTPIPEEQVASVRARLAAEAEERQNSVCAECKQRKNLMEITQCTHRFCCDCVMYWKAHYVRKPERCPKCARPLKLAAIRWLHGGCSIL